MPSSRAERGLHDGPTPWEPGEHRRKYECAQERAGELLTRWRPTDGDDDEHESHPGELRGSRQHGIFFTFRLTPATLLWGRHAR